MYVIAVRAVYKLTYLRGPVCCWHTAARAVSGRALPGRAQCLPACGKNIHHRRASAVVRHTAIPVGVLSHVVGEGHGKVRCCGYGITGTRRWAHRQ
jgi:hypothetical protein